MRCRMCHSETELAPIHQVWSEPGYRFHRCGLCGCESSDREYDPKDYHNERKADYFIQVCDGWDNVLQQLNFNVELFEGWSGGPGSLNGKRFLDVGYGDGAMLQRMRELGCEAWGYDVSNVQHEIIAERAGVPASRLVHGLAIWPHLPDYVGRFDLVQAREVIEHVPDPWSFMRVVSELLRPDGLAQIQTPKPSGIDDRNPYQSQHLILLSPVMLRAIGVAFGLIVKDYREWDIGHLVIFQKK